jgi:hypothetical protein
MRKFIGATLLAILGASALGTVSARQKDDLVDFCLTICAVREGCDKGQCLRNCITGKPANPCP